jgi:hypothetical protein
VDPLVGPLQLLPPVVSAHNCAHVTRGHVTLLSTSSTGVSRIRDVGLKNKFYRGFKPKVKDKFMKEDRYKITFNEYINIAIIINNRIFERVIEDKGVY